MIYLKIHLAFQTYDFYIFICFPANLAKSQTMMLNVIKWNHSIEKSLFTNAAIIHSFEICLSKQDITSVCFPRQ